MKLETSPLPSLRTPLILGRVSNLPTVWSNCLAGWLLGGGGFTRPEWGRFLLLGAGATALYLGGMFLNDAFDAEFDRQRRKERPIPSGAIQKRTVWRWGFGLLAAGLFCLVLPGKITALLALLLVATILFYDVIHKLLAFSPVFIAQCRFLLYLVAASCAAGGVNGLTIWSALALGAYVTGLSFIAQRETSRTPPPRWPALGLAVPVILALLVNAGPLRSSAVLLSAVLAMWAGRSLRPAWRTEQPNARPAIAGLLAGIVLVDWLALADRGRQFGFAFLGLFLLALLLQRYAPAT